ncbi:hypothetical protein LTR86_006976 [Recurvomyces mirabilis]|nr:hypothetical protein LTR86_006976 [Recurvomyces mirabilis]
MTEVHISNGSPLEHRVVERIEPIPKADFPHHLYPRWIGHKFSPGGTALHFPGNTVMAHLPSDSQFRHDLQELVDILQGHESSPAFSFLPSSSWHMTLYECVTDQIRQRKSYPGDLELDTSLNVCHAHLATHLAKFDHSLNSGVGCMTVSGNEPILDGLGLTLRPYDGRDTIMRDFRDSLSEILKMCHPGHDTYSWHMALAYTLRPLTAQEENSIRECFRTWREVKTRTFKLGKPEFCVYDDMCAFRRVFYLE